LADGSSFFRTSPRNSSGLAPPPPSQPVSRVSTSTVRSNLESLSQKTGVPVRSTSSRTFISSGGSSSGFISQPVKQPIQNFAEGSYDPNTSTFTDKSGKTYSTTNPTSVINDIRKTQAKERLTSFSKTGGITGLRSDIRPSTKISGVDSRLFTSGKTTAKKQEKSSVLKLVEKDMDKDLNQRIVREAIGADTKRPVSARATKRIQETPISPFTRATLTGATIGAGVASVPVSPVLGLIGLGAVTPTAFKQAGKTIEQLRGQKVLTLKQEQKVLRSASEAATKKVQSKGAIPSVAQEILPVFNLDREVQQEFVTEATKQIQKQGFSKQEATQLARQLAARELGLGGVGEVTGLAIASGGTEILGQKGFNFALKGNLAKEGIKTTAKGGLVQQVGKQVTKGALTKKKAANVVTKSAFQGIFPAGVVEGVAFEGIQSVSRNRPFIPERAAFAGATGGISAGVLGSIIARFAITRPTTSKALQTGLYLIDPTEKPGDIIGGRILGAKGVSGIRLPIVTNTTGFVPSFTQTNTNVKKGKSKKSRVNTPSFLNLINNQSNPFNPAGKKGISEQGFVPSFINPFANTKNDTLTIVNNNNTNTGNTTNTNNNNNNTNNDTTINNNENTNTNTNTNTTTTTATSIYTPAFTAPQSGFPMLFGGFGSGGSGRGRKRIRLNYINELNRSINTLRRSFR
jgi:hypothetical protein